MAAMTGRRGTGRRRLAVLALALVVPATLTGFSEPTPGGLSSGNVSYVATIPFESAATSARVHGKYLYVSGAKSLTIYDISNPELPVVTGTSPLGPAFPNEDIDTNGKVLLASDQ